MPDAPCPACGAVAESQGRLTADPAVEVYACAACGEFWVRPVLIADDTDR